MTSEIRPINFADNHLLELVKLRTPRAGLKRANFDHIIRNVNFMPITRNTRLLENHYRTIQSSAYACDMLSDSNLRFRVKGQCNRDEYAISELTIN